MDFFFRKKTEGLDFRPLTAIAVGTQAKLAFLGGLFVDFVHRLPTAIMIAQNYRFAFLGAFFRGALLHTSQETEFLDFLLGRVAAFSPELER